MRRDAHEGVIFFFFLASYPPNLLTSIFLLWVKAGKRCARLHGARTAPFSLFTYCFIYA